MENYVWLFPILFIFHDMEEIVGFGPWIKQNKEMLQKKYPRIFKTYENMSTEGFAVAVWEILLLCIAICIFSELTGVYYLWLGVFIAYALHLVMHMIQSIIIRKYVPALATSILCLPISVWIIRKCMEQMSVSFGIILLYSMIGIIIVVCNLKFAHFLMARFTKRMRLQEGVKS